MKWRNILTNSCQYFQKGHDLIYLLENLKSKIINLKIVEIETHIFQVVEIEICTRLWFENCRDRDSTETAIFKVVETEIAWDLTKIVENEIFARLLLNSALAHIQPFWDYLVIYCIV